MKASAFRTLLVFIALSISGCALFSQLPFSLYPRQKGQQLSVRVTWPQATSFEVEREVISLLENSFSALKYLEEISSRSYYEGGDVFLSFSEDANLDFVSLEIQSILRRIYSSFPDGLSFPTLSRTGEWKPESNPMIIGHFASPLPGYALKKHLQEKLELSFSYLPGIQRFSLTGPATPEIEISCNQDALSRYQLDFWQIDSALSSNFTAQTLGKFSLTAEQPLVGLTQVWQGSVDQLGSLLVTEEPTPISLSQVAQVSLAPLPPTHYFRLNGKESVTLLIYPTPSTNQIELSREIESIMESLTSESSFPLTWRVQSNQATVLTQEMEKIGLRSLLSLGIILLLIILTERKGRVILNLILSLVVNLALAGLGFWLFGVEINLYTLAGLTISFGLMVDNAIVVVHHYSRPQGNRLGQALWGASLTTIASALTVFLLPKEDQAILGQFGGVIIIALLSSLLVASFFTPALHRALPTLTPKKPIATISTPNRRYMAYLSRVAPYRRWLLAGLIWLFGLPVFLLPKKWEQFPAYEQWINSKEFRRYQPTINEVLGGTLHRFFNSVRENYRTADPSEYKLEFSYTMPRGSDIEDINQIFHYLESYLGELGPAVTFFTNISAPEVGKLTVVFDLKDISQNYPFQVMQELRSRALDWGGYKSLTVSGIGSGFSDFSGGQNNQSFTLTLRGSQYQTLDHYTQELVTLLEGQSKISQINPNASFGFWDESFSNLTLQLDPQKAGGFPLETSAFNTLLAQQDIAPLRRGKLFVNGEFYPYAISLRRTSTSTPYSIRNLELRTKDRRISLSAVSSTSTTKIPATILRENRQYVRVINFSYNGSSRFGNKLMERLLAPFQQQLPLGYQVKNENQSTAGTNQPRLVAVLIIVLAVLLISATLFESYRLAGIITLLIPLSYIGIFLTFSVGEFFFDQGGYASFLLLGGLVVNAGIFIVNDIPFALRKSANAQVVAESVRRKRNPILLTVISTCFGLMPFLISPSPFWFSFAVGSIGGLCFSLLIIFFVLPLFLVGKGIQQ